MRAGKFNDVRDIGGEMLGMDTIDKPGLTPVLDAEEPRRTLAMLRGMLRHDPADQRARMFLFQLLCIEGEWDKARMQLGTMARLSPEAQMLGVAYGQAIQGELARGACFAGRGRASVLVDPLGWSVGLAEAMQAEASGDVALSVQLRSDALDRCPDVRGTIDGEPFETLFDGDTRFGPVLEAIVAGRWGLIPFSAIDEIVSAGPVDLRDLVWQPAEVRFRDGPALAALLPVRYPGVEAEADAGLRLARRTEWREADYALHGAGQRVWTTGAGDEVGILAFRRIKFARP
jgi:type VI secretion system protein ImpE